MKEQGFKFKCKSFKARDSSLPSCLYIVVITDLNVGSIVPEVLAICTRDFTTSAGKIATHNATPPIPPETMVRKGPEKTEDTINRT